MAHSFLEYRGSWTRVNDLEAEIILLHVVKLARAEDPVDPLLEAFSKHCEEELQVAGSGILNIDFDKYLADESARIKVLDYLSQIGERLCSYGEATPSEWRLEVCPNDLPGETSAWIWLRAVSQFRALLTEPLPADTVQNKEPAIPPPANRSQRDHDTIGLITKALCGWAYAATFVAVISYTASLLYGIYGTWRGAGTFDYGSPMKYMLLATAWALLNAVGSLLLLGLLFSLNKVLSGAHTAPSACPSGTNGLGLNRRAHTWFFLVLVLVSLLAAFPSEYAKRHTGAIFALVLGGIGLVWMLWTLNRTSTMQGKQQNAPANEPEEGKDPQEDHRTGSHLTGGNRS